jgi:exonuclease SbcC
MRPLQLQMKDFARYYETSVDLTQINLAVIVGKNGSGKSSLLDAITFALFGEGTRGNKKEIDNYVTRGRNECTVDETFELGGNVYRVVRSRNLKRNKTNLSFYLQDGAEWIDLSGKTSTDTQAKIEDVLRIDYKTFSSSSLILQGQSGNFTAMPESERKEAFCKILGLDIWDKMLEKVKEQQKSLKTDVMLLENQEKALSAVVDGKVALLDSLTTLTTNADSLKARIIGIEGTLAANKVVAGQESFLRASLAETDKVIESHKRIIVDNDAKAAKANQQIKEAENQIESCQKILNRRDEIEAAVKAEAELSDELNRQETKYRQYVAGNDKAGSIERESAKWEIKWHSDITRLDDQIKAAKKQTAVMDQVPCTGDVKGSCLLLDGAKKAAQELAKLEGLLEELNNKVNPFTESWQDALKERDDLGYDQNVHNLIKEQYADARQLASERAQLNSATDRVNDLNKKIAELRESMAELQNKSSETNLEIVNLQKRRSELADQLSGLKDIAGAIDRESAMLDDLRNKQKENDTETGGVKRALEQAGQAETDLGEVRRQLLSVKDNLAVYDILNQACGKKGGVPALILENAVPEVERLANDLLEKMADGRFALRIDTQVVGKSTHETQEAFRITVLDSGVEGPYETYSGAERFMIDLSLRVAISKFLAHRAGAEIRLLVLGEGLGACDPDNRQAVMDAIRTVSKDFAITLVITHIGELQDEFSQRIDVERGTGGSRVNVVV